MASKHKSRLPPFEPIRNQAEALRFAMKKRDEGALFAVNHSGGKDSQAMLMKIRELVPPDQILVVHADLGNFEDVGSWEQVKHLSKGLKAEICRAEKTFLQMVKRRRAGLLKPTAKHPHGRPDTSPWPSSDSRQCTSDLKRGPSTKLTKRYADEHGFHIIIDALGLRAAESGPRALLAKLHAREREYGVKSNRTGKIRQWYVWHPIHDLTHAEVWKIVRSSGMKPHPVYATGKTRAGCKLCILGKKSDLQIGALYDPELYRDFIKMEKEVGHTIHFKKATRAEPARQVSLEEWTGIPVSVAMRAKGNPAERDRLIAEYVTIEEEVPTRPKGARRLPMYGEERTVMAEEILRSAGKPRAPRSAKKRTNAGDMLLASIREAMRAQRRRR